MSNACPYNKSFQFEKCDKVKCPYHVSRSEDIFKVGVNTGCIKLDAPWIASALSDDSLSSLDKTDYAKVNHRRIRRDIEETLGLAKSIVLVYSDVPDSDYCNRCGMVHSTCTGSEVCSARLDWVTRAKNVLKINSDNPVISANIWNLLKKNKLYLNSAVLERHGRALLPV